MNTQNTNVISIDTSLNKPRSSSLNQTVRSCLEQYFIQLDGDQPSDLYNMVLQQVEEPLLELLLDYVDGNQSRAAECLGLNRGTLRKKLKTYNLIK
ncbi:MAG: DNA-binding transcriptional regulator Fis [Gammaproteobacteria bacterium]|nr:DNA-binding transcriptional regulator Fis [Gammaproteobacteria bacterium]MDH5736380.1 DNA-binding transcriptional regulator Fis [Gammaproteobacteria bacterium]